MKYDIVQNPSHYVEGRKYEPALVIADWGLDFFLGNTVKYISRCGRKDDAIQELKKAKWYLDKKIELMESTTKKEDILPQADITSY